MKQFVLPIFCVMVIACNHQKILTNREKLDSIKVGMTLSEVLAIYGPLDTTNRTSKSGECGYESDTVTMERYVGSELITPILCVVMTDSTSFFFSKGKLMMKPELTWEEMKKDSKWLRIDSLLNEHTKIR